MKALFFILTFLLTSSFLHSQTVAPMVFGDEYRIIKDMDVERNVVAVVSVNDAINAQEKPFHLAIYRNEQWTLVPSIYMNNGILDTILVNQSPKVQIASNNDIWVAAKNLCKYSNGKWTEYEIEEDTSVKERTFDHIQITNDNKLLVLCTVHGGADIFTVDLDDFDLKKRTVKFENQFVSQFRQYPYESVFSVDGYTISQKIRFSNPLGFNGDFWIQTPDDTILQFEIPTPKGEISNRRVKQIFAENINEIWVVTDLSTGKVGNGTPYECCAGIYKLKNLNQWEIISDVSTYPSYGTPIYNMPAFNVRKLNDSSFVFLSGLNKLNQMFNEVFLYDIERKKFNKTNWDIVVKNSVGFRASDYLINETKLADILEAFSKNEKSTFLQSDHEFIKFHIDENGNYWFMSKAFILKTPPIMHPTSVSENDLNQQFRIVPNPASQTISLKGKTELLKHIEILNLQGETLIKVDGEFNNISIRPFANGVYFVRKVFKDGSEEFSKFVKE
jgi:hypothetical protein